MCRDELGNRVEEAAAWASGEEEQGGVGLRWGRPVGYMRGRDEGVGERELSG